MNKGFKRQSGLTLVELMVATTLSLVLLAAIFFMQKALNKHYETGLFADKNQTEAQP